MRTWTHARGAVFAQAAVCAAGVAVAVAALADFFSTPFATGVLLAGVAVAGGLCAALVGPRGSRVAVAASGIGGFVALAAVLLHPAALWPPSPSVLAVLATDVWHGWGRMLSVNLPADALPSMLTLPVLVTWAAAFASTTVAARSDSALAPAVPLVAAEILATTLVDGRPSRHLLAAAGLAACIGLLVWLRVRYPHAAQAPLRDTRQVTVTVSRHGWGASAVHAAVTLGVLAAVIGLGALGTLGAATLLPAPFDPRTIDPPPVAVRPSVTPLTLVTTQLRQAPRSLFRVRIQSDVPVDRMRTAVLDHYDGATWSSGARFLVAGRVLPGTPDAPRGRAVATSVVLDSWSSPFLPVFGVPTGIGGSEVSGEQAGYDTGTETLVWAGPTPRGTTYTVTGLVPDVDDGVRSAPVANLRAADEPPPDVPAALRTVAQATLGGPGTPWERLHRLEAFLRAKPYSTTVPAGHSFAALEQLTTASAPADAGQVEQHAAAFALLARLAGFPARVAVGYRLPKPGPDGVEDVTSREAHAWPEVHFAGYGWVAFEPTDTSRRAPDPPAAVTAPPPPPPPPLPPPPALSPILAPPSPSRPRTFMFLAVVGSLVLAAGITLAAGGIVAAKAVRRHRRQHGAAEDRVRGAWEEALDVLSDRAFVADPARGFALTPALTPDDTAWEAKAAFGEAAQPLDRLAALVTRVRFGNVAPVDADAEHAWRLTTALRRGLDAGPRARYRLIRATLDPRSLWRQAALRWRARRCLRHLGLETP